MPTINTKKFTLHFGDAHSEMPTVPTAFLKQVHGTTCRLVSAPENREHEGDALLTSTRGLGIGVVTADCLPLALYDSTNHAAAIVHAGWRGAVAGIAAQTLKEMHTHFGTLPENVTAYIGPCARWCCYEVGPAVAAQVPVCALAARDGRTYLDMRAFIKAQLVTAGIAQAQVLCEDTCTICSPQYHSYRRDGGKAGRNTTVIILA